MRELTKEEQKWLNDNQSYIDRDYRERDSREYIEGEMGNASFSERADTRSLADIETISELNDDDLVGYSAFIENAEYLSVFEKELLKLRFTKKMSLRQIEKMVQIKTVVNEVELIETYMSNGHICRLLKNAGAKIRCNCSEFSINREQ